jgi:hypothetical protein
MTAIWCLIVMVVAVVAVAAGAVWRRRTGHGRKRLEQARKLFHLRREWLEARFLSLISQNSQPRQLIWSDCDFDDEVVFATDRETGQLHAFAAVSIRFDREQDHGGDMNPSVGKLHAATAVFQFDHGQWRTDGRAVFNLNPLETVERFQHHLQSVE